MTKIWVKPLTKPPRIWSKLSSRSRVCAEALYPLPSLNPPANAEALHLCATITHECLGLFSCLHLSFCSPKWNCNHCFRVLLADCEIHTFTITEHEPCFISGSPFQSCSV